MQDQGHQRGGTVANSEKSLPEGKLVIQLFQAERLPPAKAERLEWVQPVSETAGAAVQNVLDDGRLQSSIRQPNQ